MRHVTRLTVLLSALAVAVLLLVSPAAATESGGGETGGTETSQTEGGAGGEEEREKIEIPENPHDRVGLVLVVLTGLAALLALDNARRQLKGERRQATGEWRWR